MLTEFHHFNLLHYECQYGYNVLMPKKTKKEKIAAQNSRQTKSSISSIQLEYKDRPTALANSAGSSSRSSSNKSSFDTNQMKENTHYFKSDLKKSLFIIASILAIELGLYYAGMQGLLKFM